jgi:hypothetical protein
MNLNIIKSHIKHLADSEVVELLECVSDEMKNRNKGKVPTTDIRTKEQAKEFLANLVSVLSDVKPNTK